MKSWNKLLLSTSMLVGSLLTAISGLAQTLSTHSTTLPPQAVVGSTPQRQAAYNSFTAEQQRIINDKVRPRVQSAIVQALINRQANIAAQDLKVHAPNLDGIVRHDLSRTLTLQDPLTLISGGGALSSVPLYPATAAAFPTNPASGQIPGPDLDHDGLPDNFENQLADLFTPFYHVSGGEPDNFATFFDSVPETVNQRLGPHPFSYFRVKPLGFATSQIDGREYGIMQVNYLTLWDHDSGLDVSLGCNIAIGTASGVLGISLINLMSVLTSHDKDDEHSAALLAAPSINGAFNLDPSQYVAINYYLAAHEGTFFDHSVYVNPATPVPADLHLQLGLSRNKHSTYDFNPNGLPMFPDELIAAYYAIVSELFAEGVISPDEYDYLLYIGDTVFFVCVIEHFSEQGGAFASGRVNVGEPVAGSTINGSGFILDSDHALPKLTETIWIVGTPPIIVNVTPGAAGINSSQSVQFQALVFNAPNNSQSVIWSIDPQLGSITQTGLYTAPAVTGQQTVTIIACSTSDSSRCGRAIVFVNPLAQVCLSPGSLAFGNQILGTTSPAQSANLTNCGSAGLLISSIATNSAFAETNNCPSDLAANASCSISVTFTPSALAAFNGQLSVTDSALNSPHTVSLTGTGVPVPDFTLSIDPNQTVDYPMFIYTVTIHYGVTFINGLTGTVSLSLSADFCSTGQVDSLSQSTFTTSGTGTFTIQIYDPSGAGLPMAQCYRLTGVHNGISKMVETDIYVNPPPP